jgi:hypothetical protein
LITSPTILPADYVGEVPLPKRLILVQVTVFFPDSGPHENPLKPSGKRVIRFVVAESKMKARALITCKLKEHGITGWASIKTHKVPPEGLQLPVQ